ncbi:MAG: hypothetical protein OQK12_06140, partial [Motiliproteus sp.]|nr:hypothetical protein [Motiliproteus sp.]
MDMRDISELILEADFLWREINIGDRVQVEEPQQERGVELLSPGREYMVLVKQCSDTGLQSFIIESNIKDRLTRVYPHNICHYVVGEKF